MLRIEPPRRAPVNERRHGGGGPVGVIGNRHISESVKIEISDRHVPRLQRRQLDPSFRGNSEFVSQENVDYVLVPGAATRHCGANRGRLGSRGNQKVRIAIAIYVSGANGGRVVKRNRDRSIGSIPFWATQENLHILGGWPIVDKAISR